MEKKKIDKNISTPSIALPSPFNVNSQRLNIKKYGGDTAFVWTSANGNPIAWIISQL